MSPNPTYLRYSCIFSTYLHVIPSGVPIRTLYTVPFSVMHEICPMHLILLDMNIVMMLVDKYKKRHSSLLSILPHYLSFFLLISKYSLTTHFCFSVSDKFRTHTKQQQYDSHLFLTCRNIYAKKANGSAPNGCKYSSNLTSYLSITPKYVHFKHFLRIHNYLCSVTFSNALLIRLHRHWFPRLIPHHSSF